MLFNSYIFIFLFLPLTLAGWYLLNHYRAHEMAKVFLAGMSLWFYGYFNTYYLAIILLSIGANYLISWFFSRSKENWTNRLCLFAGIVTNLGILFYFKYYDFFLDNINILFRQDFNLKHIVLPLGISFFTFQQLSFIIDRYRGDAPHYSLVNYVTFVTFFPQLIAGPIVLHSELVPQFEDLSGRKLRADRFARGLSMFVMGLAKKVLLADVLALLTNFGFEKTYFLDTPSTILVVVAYTFQIYFDFSGYSDMAVGLGHMFNITLPINFNSPYKACSVKELWQRWHMTLSRFFITYVYVPLGGSRRGKGRTMLNTMIIFTLSGLWHGSNWTYVAWGFMQGLLVVWDNLGIIGVHGSVEKKHARFYIPRWLGWLFTFSFFNLSLFFFRSVNMSYAFQMFRNLFSFRNTGYIHKLAANMDIPEFYLIKQAVTLIAPDSTKVLYLFFMFLVLIISAFILTRKNTMQIVAEAKYNTGFAFWIALLFVWCVISFSQVSTFIYFNF